jgi:hypothetical protein
MGLVIEKAVTLREVECDDEHNNLPTVWKLNDGIPKLLILPYICSSIVVQKRDIMYV